MPTTHSFIKRPGAPPGRLTVMAGNDTLVIDDGVNKRIVTFDDRQAAALREIPFLVYERERGAATVETLVPHLAELGQYSS